MKKLIYLSLIVILFSCKHKPVFDCSKEIHGTQDTVEVGFMLHGGILDQYDNGRVFISIVKITDRRNWEHNQYFTGTDFSENEDEEMKVIDSDSCKLKELYFEFLKTEQP